MKKDRKKLNIVVFSTRNADKPTHFKSAEEDINNYPSVLQFGAILFQIDLDNLDNIDALIDMETLIRPFRKGKEVKIHPKAELVSGIDFNKANALGTSIEQVAISFQGLCNSADFIVAHNYTLHRGVMASELLRLGIPAKYNRSAKIFCTMKHATTLMTLRGRNSVFRFAALSELYNHLTGCTIKETYEHSFGEGARADCHATLHCFVQLIKQDKDVRGWLEGTIEKIY